MDRYREQTATGVAFVLGAIFVLGSASIQTIDVAGMAVPTDVLGTLVWAVGFAVGAAARASRGEWRPALIRALGAGGILAVLLGASGPAWLTATGVLALAVSGTYLAVGAINGGFSPQSRRS
ncbi:MAG: hypothetical protein ABEJ08_03805 [Halobacteriaceae archaeon]